MADSPTNAPGLVRLDDGAVRRPDDRTVTVGIAGPLQRGTYTVTWRVVSADAHPVHTRLARPNGDAHAHGDRDADAEP